MTSHRLIDQVDSVGPIPVTAFKAQNSYCNNLFGIRPTPECQIGKFYDRRFGTNLNMYHMYLIVVHYVFKVQMLSNKN